MVVPVEHGCDVLNSVIKRDLIISEDVVKLAQKSSSDHFNNLINFKLYPKNREFLFSRHHQSGYFCLNGNLLSSYAHTCLRIYLYFTVSMHSLIAKGEPRHTVCATMSV